MAAGTDQNSNPKRPILQVTLARNAQDVREAQQLRYQVFAQEMGASLESAEEGLDRDRFDPHCDHLLVRDMQTQELVGCTRILTGENAAKAGGYYSQSEFDLSRVLPLPGAVMEVGRTCIHPDYRSGSAIGVLWGGLAQFMVEHDINYMMGCASIGMEDGGYQAHALMQQIRERYLSPAELRVFPHHELPELHIDTPIKAQIPPLLKAYLRLGVYVCGEACWDRAFNVADFFILLDMERLSARYERHFVKRLSNGYKEGYENNETRP